MPAEFPRPLWLKKEGCRMPWDLQLLQHARDRSHFPLPLALAGHSSWGTSQGLALGMLRFQFYPDLRVSFSMALPDKVTKREQGQIPGGGERK